MKIFFSSSFFVRLFDYRKSIARKEHFKNSLVFFFLEKSHSFSFCVCFFSFSLFLYFFVSTTIHVCHIAFFFLSRLSLTTSLFLTLLLSHFHYLSTCLSHLLFLSFSFSNHRENKLFTILKCVYRCFIFAFYLPLSLPFSLPFSRRLFLFHLLVPHSRFFRPSFADKYFLKSP